VVRYETPTGKETPPLTLWRRKSDGLLKWRFKGFAEPRPLFNLAQLAAAPSAQVIVVEGEKCAQALQACIEAAGMAHALVAVAWPGGVQAIHKIDWLPLRGRKIVLWPDFDLQAYPVRHPRAGQVMDTHDQPGYCAMVAIAGILGSSCELRMINPVPGKPAGWDVADAIQKDGWDFVQIVEFIKTNRADLDAAPQPPGSAQAAGPADRQSEAPAAGLNSPAAKRRDDTDLLYSLSGARTRFLGTRSNVCFFLSGRTRQLHEIRISDLGKRTLIELEEITFWERNFPAIGERSKIAWDSAIEAVINACVKAGPYDPGRRRGRGAWFDNGRIVIHIGDRILDNGNSFEPQEFESEFIYELAPRIEFKRAGVLPVDQARVLYDIAKTLYFERKSDAFLLCGWIVIAPICGALEYRPHVWLTGAAQTGKSFIVENIIEPVLGAFSLNVQSATTAAGIRQTLGCDAFCVIHDEFEGEDEPSQARIQATLELARQSFSESGAKIIKGGATGRPLSFHVRSSFCFSSINVTAHHYADLTRMAVLGLTMPHDRLEMTKQQHIEFLQEKCRLLTPQWCAAFRARSIQMVSVIRESMGILSKMISARANSARTGDLLGTLLAGFYSLLNDNVITTEAAEKLVQAIDLDKQEKTDLADERQCLQKILDGIIRTGEGKERNIGELLAELNGCTEPALLDHPALIDLARWGIRYERVAEKPFIVISNTHSGIAKFLRGTRWAAAWMPVLRRMPGAVSGCKKWFHGSQTRAISIPATDLLPTAGDCQRNDDWGEH